MNMNNEFERVLTGLKKSPLAEKFRLMGPAEREEFLFMNAKFLNPNHWMGKRYLKAKTKKGRGEALDVLDEVAYNGGEVAPYLGEFLRSLDTLEQ